MAGTGRAGPMELGGWCLSWRDVVGRSGVCVFARARVCVWTGRPRQSGPGRFRPDLKSWARPSRD